MTVVDKPGARFARQRAGQIRQGMRDYLKTLALIKQAWDERDWEPLGYDSWQSYVDGEFGAERLGLSAEHRRKAVEELRLAGMSQRAIGAALGVSQKTVDRVLDAVESSDSTGEVVGVDGKTYSSGRPPLVEAIGEAIAGATGRVEEKARIREQYDRVREDLAAVPAATVAEVMRATQPTVDLRRIGQACRDLTSALRGIDPESAAAAECDADELRAIDDAIDLLTRLHNALGVPA